MDDFFFQLKRKKRNRINYIKRILIPSIVSWNYQNLKKEREKNATTRKQKFFQIRAAMGNNIRK